MKAQIASLADAVRAQTEKADQRGTRTYEELENIRVEQAQSRRDMAEVKARLDKAEPTLSEITRWKERFNGMQMMLMMQAAAVGGLMVYFWKWIAVKIGMN
ncbi:putative nucleic acid-binding Zn-ribbon protein [Gellertiella hungarica]|uniref:Putative nucleic acid-binding Zn-ribbon protein n=2 Tax=Gellertiella hungarica TaxID=1572859 RepID=A0A7W6J2V1_9HYPH|nr:putative nucleic acid-binding Zn-ribbon protein [Gellertiella hungarica]